MPFDRHLLFETTDIDEACEKVGKIYCKHRIEFAGSGRHLSVRQHVVPLERLALSYITYGEEVRIDVGEPDHCYMVHSIDHGGCEMQIGRRTVSAGPAMGVVSSATLPLRMRWSANCGHLVLKVDRRALERHLSDLLDDAILRPIEFHPEFAAASGPSVNYRRLVDFVSSELECSDAFFSSRLGIRHVEETLMTFLLTTLPNSYLDILSKPICSAAPRHVLRAEEFINANADRDISIREIAQASGVSVRTLFEGFKRFRGSTPLAKLRAVRLEKVHNELKAAGPTASITEIALKWGFVNLGRFAQTYRARYGVLPSHTLRK